MRGRPLARAPRVRPPAARTLPVAPACACSGSAVPGVLHGELSGPVVDEIERCDECERFPGDLEAAQALATHLGGGTVRFEDQDGTERHFDPDAGLPEGTFIGTGTDPWVVLSGNG
ncbi:MAG: hypothetical protein ACRD0J_06580 [Acidimicrobiales bacterium]